VCEGNPALNTGFRPVGELGDGGRKTGVTGSGRVQELIGYKGRGQEKQEMLVGEGGCQGSILQGLSRLVGQYRSSDLIRGRERLDNRWRRHVTGRIGVR